MQKNNGGTELAEQIPGTRLTLTKFSSVLLQGNQRAMGQITVEYDGTKELLPFEAEKDRSGKWNITGKKCRFSNTDPGTKETEPFLFRFDPDAAVHAAIESVTARKLLAQIQSGRIAEVETILLLGPPSETKQFCETNGNDIAKNRILELYNQLTGYQKQIVAEFMKEDCRAQEIAERLGIKRASVHGHSHRILNHFGFKNRKELVRVFGVIPEINGVKPPLDSETNTAGEKEVAEQKQPTIEGPKTALAKQIASTNLPDEEIIAVGMGKRLLHWAEASRRALPSGFRLEYSLRIGEGGVVEGAEIHVRNVDIRMPAP